MPRYHCLNTEVQLHIWNPELPATLRPISSDPILPAPVFDLGLSSSPSLGAVFDSSSSNHAWVSSRDPAGSCETTRVKEEFFKGYAGIQFLGNCTPFYIIRTAKDLNNFASPAAQQITMPSSYSSHEQFNTSQSSLSDSSLSEIDAERLKDVYDNLDEASISISHASAMDDTASLPEFSSSFIPSLSNQKLSTTLSPQMDVPNSKEPEGTDRLQVQGNPFLLLGNPTFPEIPHGYNQGSALPMKIVVKLSDASFISPSLRPDGDQGDICISIFINGEFTTSDIISYSSWAANNRVTSIHYSGKRVQPNHEVPWIIDLGRRRDGGLPQSLDKGNRMSSPSERWKALSEALLDESNIWSIGKGGRQTPVGTYLAQLSKEILPHDTNFFSNTSNSFGVVDVVISYGSSVCRKEAVPQDMLRRKLRQAPVLTEGHSMEDVMASNGSKSVEVTSMTALLNKTLQSNKSSSSESKLDPERSKLISNVLNPIRMPDSPLGQQGRYNSSKLIATTSGRNLSSSAVPSHPGRPKVIPQKRYRGLDPEPGSSKRMKASKPLGTSISTPISMATRSRRSAGIPREQTPQSSKSVSLNNINGMTRIGEETKRTAIAGMQIESLHAVYPPVLLTGGLARSQQKGMVMTPQTPRSRTKPGRQGKPVKYNPKYSNRPQNLRRKNSAGEWETPTKPRWHVESAPAAIEGESSTREELRRISQPNFNLGRIKGSPATFNGPLTTEEMSMSNNALSLDFMTVSATPNIILNEKSTSNEKLAPYWRLSQPASTTKNSANRSKIAVQRTKATVVVDSHENLSQARMDQKNTPRTGFMVPNHNFRVLSEHLSDADMASGETPTNESSIDAKGTIFSKGAGLSSRATNNDKANLSATRTPPQSQTRNRTKCTIEQQGHSFNSNLEVIGASYKAPESTEEKEIIMAEASRRVNAYRAQKEAHSKDKTDVEFYQVPNERTIGERGSSSWGKTVRILKIPVGSIQLQGPKARVFREPSQDPADSNKPAANQTTKMQKTSISRLFNVAGIVGNSRTGVESDARASIVPKTTSITRVDVGSITEAVKKSLKETGESLIETIENPVAIESRTGKIQKTSDQVHLSHVMSPADNVAESSGSSTKHDPPKLKRYGSTIVIRRQSKAGENGLLAAVNKETGNARKNEARNTTSHTKKNGRNAATVIMMSSLPKFSQPPPLCEDSILTYATTQTWPGLVTHPATGQSLRVIATDNDDNYFETAGVAMGVRYVIDF